MNLRPALIVFVVALLVRLGVVLFMLPQLRPDQNPDLYRELGRNMALGKGFVAAAPDGRELPDINRPPGYPAFLAGLMLIFGDRLGVLLAANCVLAAIGCALTVVMASRWLRPGAAMLAGLITALEPNSVMRSCLVMAEALFTLFLLVGVCALVWRREKNSAWCLCGVVWALATLCRAIGLWLPLVVLAVAFLWRMRWRPVALFLIGFLPLIGLWMARNASLTGHWFYSLSAQNSTVTGWAARLEAERTGVSTDVARARLLERTGSLEFFDGREAFEKTQREQAKVIYETLGAKPWRRLPEIVKGTAETLLGPGKRTLDAFLRDLQPTPRWRLMAGTGYMLALVVLAICGSIRHTRALAVVTVLVLYFLALSVCSEGNSRYRYPIIPLLSVLAVAACARTLEPGTDATKPLHHGN
ncbi:MAG TPA: glycosyltransferase family 39 protein [Verrucomicrobiae bacterium]|nr:glycosyltransferase family 39 protein [Verrucomicrobiae bacterium]